MDTVQYRELHALARFPLQMSHDTGHQLRNNTEFIATLSITLRRCFALVYCKGCTFNRNIFTAKNHAGNSSSGRYRYRVYIAIGFVLSSPDREKNADRRFVRGIEYFRNE